MISTAYIKEWKQHAPWTRNDQVEQDLIIRNRDLAKVYVENWEKHKRHSKEK
jgi:hypothetical protein